MNRGDAVRILPVVPRLVEEVADEKIEEGFAQGMAQLASQHPFVYRRWMRRPNGLIGRAVNNGISQAMSQANQAKWQAVREAGAATQKIYEDLMGELGVRRYFLDLETDGNFYDPDTELGTGEIRALVLSLTGMTVGDIANKMIASGGAGQPQMNSDKIKGMVSKVRFPDGLPVSEVARLLNAYRADGNMDLPSGVDFRLGQDGKVEVTRHHEVCECYFEPQLKQCILTFTMATDKTVRYFPADGASNGSCDVQTQCPANFVKTGRAVNLIKACSGSFRERATGRTFLERLP